MSFVLYCNKVYEVPYAVDLDTRKYILYPRKTLEKKGTLLGLGIEYPEYKRVREEHGISTVKGWLDYLNNIPEEELLGYATINGEVVPFYKGEVDFIYVRKHKIMWFNLNKRELRLNFIK